MSNPSDDTCKEKLKTSASTVFVSIQQVIQAAQSLQSILRERQSSMGGRPGTMIDVESISVNDFENARSELSTFIAAATDGKDMDLFVATAKKAAAALTVIRNIAKSASLSSVDANIKLVCLLKLANLRH